MISMRTDLTPPLHDIQGEVVCWTLAQALQARPAVLRGTAYAAAGVCARASPRPHTAAPTRSARRTHPAGSCTSGRLWLVVGVRASELRSAASAVGRTTVASRCACPAASEAERALRLSRRAERVAVAEPLVETAFVASRLIAESGDTALADQWLPRIASGDAVMSVGHDVNTSLADAHIADLILVCKDNALYAIDGKSVNTPAEGLPLALLALLNFSGEQRDQASAAVAVDAAPRPPAAAAPAAAAADFELLKKRLLGGDRERELRRVLRANVHRLFGF